MVNINSKEDFNNEILGNAKPGLLLTFNIDNKDPRKAISTQKVGGAPLFPAGSTWPTCKMCRNNLSYIGQFTPKSLGINKKGILSFFACLICEPNANTNSQRAFLSHHIEHIERPVDELLSSIAIQQPKLAKPFFDEAYNFNLVPCLISRYRYELEENNYDFTLQKAVFEANTGKNYSLVLNIPNNPAIRQIKTRIKNGIEAQGIICDTIGYNYAQGHTHSYDQLAPIKCKKCKNELVPGLRLTTNSANFCNPTGSKTVILNMLYCKDCQLKSTAVHISKY